MRALLLVAVVGGCVRSAPPPAQPIVAGQLVIGTEQPLEAAAVLLVVAVDGYRFEYVAAASQTSHLVRATTADGAELTADATTELVAKLQGRPGVRYVELNSMRQPR